MCADSSVCVSPSSRGAVALAQSLAGWQRDRRPAAGRWWLAAGTRLRRRSAWRPWGHRESDGVGEWCSAAVSRLPAIQTAAVCWHRHWRVTLAPSYILCWYPASAVSWLTYSMGGQTFSTEGHFENFIAVGGQHIYFVCLNYNFQPMKIWINDNNHVFCQLNLHTIWPQSSINNETNVTVHSFG